MVIAKAENKFVVPAALKNAQNRSHAFKPETTTKGVVQIRLKHVHHTDVGSSPGACKMLGRDGNRIELRIRAEFERRSQAGAFPSSTRSKLASAGWIAQFGCGLEPATSGAGPLQKQNGIFYAV